MNQSPARTHARFSPAALRKILLIQTVERLQPDLLDQDAHTMAAVAALAADSDAQILERRAEQLCTNLPTVLNQMARRPLWPPRLSGAALVCGLVLGLLTNFLGPAHAFHIVYNPVSALLLWNLLILLAGLAWWIRSLSDRAPTAERLIAPSGPMRLAFLELLRRFSMRGLRLGETKEQERIRPIIAAWWTRQLQVTAPLWHSRLQLTLHLGAIGIGVGAIAGFYLRGFFVEYHAIWRSSFVTDPAAVATLLNLLLYPAIIILDGGAIQAETATQLMSPAGAAGSPWLHRLAFMTLLVVVIPRAVLAVRAQARARHWQHLPLDLNEPALRATLREVKQRHIHRIREGAASEIRAEICDFSQRIASFVREALFDQRITPALLEFRQTGGSISSLEQELQERTIAFQPILGAHLDRVQTAFEQALKSRLRLLVGRELQVENPQLGPNPLAEPSRLSDGVANAVANDVTGAIGVIVTTAISATLGSLSGGIGKSIGIAVISHLLGTSGPVGLLIGAALGLVGGGAAFILGRDRMRRNVKSWHIPAALAKLALRESKLAASRNATEAAVRTQIQAQLEPAINDITEGLLRQLPQEVFGSRAR